MKQFNRKEFKKEIKSIYGNMRALKQELLRLAEDTGYGCSVSEIKLPYGVKVCYTSNDNHFAKFYMKLYHIGGMSTYALDKSSFTKAGKTRLGHNLKPYMI